MIKFITPVEESESANSLGGQKICTCGAFCFGLGLGIELLVRPPVAVEKRNFELMIDQTGLLTIVIPTQNCVRDCLAQLRFFRSCGLKNRIVVADSSNDKKRARRDLVART